MRWCIAAGVGCRTRAGAVEQRQAELVFQARYGGEHCRVRTVQLRGCRLEAAVAHEGSKHCRSCAGEVCRRG